MPIPFQREPRLAAEVARNRVASVCLEVARLVDRRRLPPPSAGKPHEEELDLGYAC